jgi:alpha-1,3-mannosyltransferase
MTPDDDSFPRLACPAPSGSRYDYLRSNSSITTDPGVRRQYFFALDLHQCAPLLPRLLGSIVETMRFLGPWNCALSVVEGRSDDGTFEILKVLREDVEQIGAKYFFNTNEIDPTADGGDRITALAELRNQALKPLVNYPDQYSTESAVVFLNDVSLCMEDILELIHQRLYQKADMTCAINWTYVGTNPTFYNVWIARGMNSDSFFNIPEDGSWDLA